VTQAEIDEMRARLAASAVPSKSEVQELEKRLADIKPIPERTLGEEAALQGEAFARGSARGATFNFADEIGGVLGAADEFLRRAAPGGSAGEFPEKPLGEALAARYEQEREANQREAEALKSEAPVASTLGELVGAAAVPVPGAGAAAGMAARIAKPLKTTLRLTRPVVQGALGGALQGIGEGEGTERITEGLKGAVTGGALAGGLGALAEKAPSALHGLAEEMAPRALGTYGGISNRLRSRGYESAEDIAELGQEAIQRGYVKPGSTKAEIQAKAEAVLENAGKGIDKIYQAAKRQGLVWDFVRSAQKANEPLRNLPVSSYRPKVIGPAQEFIDDILAQGKLETENAFPNARKLKTAAQKAVNWAEYAKEAPALKRKAVNAMSNDLIDQIGEQMGEETAAKLRKLNTDYGIAADIKEIATEAATREKQKGNMQWMAGGAMGGPAGAALGSVFGPGGAALGSVLGGAAAAKALGTAQRVGPAYTTAYAEKAANFLAKHGAKLRAATQGGHLSTAAANYVLSARDPEYRRDADELRKTLEGE
jgi:hypothetical protein